LSKHHFNTLIADRRRLLVLGLCLLLITLLAGFAAAQRRQRKPPSAGPAIADGSLPKTDPKLSGRFTFVRLRFDTSQYGYLYNYNTFLGDGGPPWSHDYPMASRHLMKIMAELSKIDASLDLNEPILTFDDPLLFKFPFAYLCEAGFMSLGESEIAGRRLPSPEPVRQPATARRSGLSRVRVETARSLSPDLQLLLLDQHPRPEPGLWPLL
jgi:hypothetical protein